jgi:predicted metalloprotease with PDZ domain
MFLTVCAVVVGGYALRAQSPGPQPVPMPPPIAAALDTPYPGTIQVRVDATDIARHIFSVHETIPVRGGQPLVLLYPQWWPGHHSPVGRADLMGGLMMHAVTGRGGSGNAQAPARAADRLEWTRDPVEAFAFHVNVPAGASAIDVDFQFTSPVDPGEGRMVMTPDMLSLQWTSSTMYPAGYFARDVTFQPSVKLPDGWQFATALETQSTANGVTAFKPVNYETLIDSPMISGRYFKVVDLDPGAAVPVRLDVMADRPELLEMKPEQIAAHRALVQQAYKLFGSHHYNHYDFLFSLTNQLGGIGLEHHQSSEDGSIPGYFADWDRSADTRNILPHEYTHSWNGKFRRPADLWTPNFNVPMRDSLLWVYEGQTQYWGYVLEARSGLMTKQQALDAIAATAATYDVARAGRAWKTLADTTNDPIDALRRPLPWRSWARSEDYYSEGQLIWLDADTLIREKSNDQKSLDDFARAFFGVDDGSFAIHTYTFEDVAAALNKVVPYDWASFLRTRLDSHGPGGPLDGVKRGGYSLVYSETPTDYWRQGEVRTGVNDLTYSIGLALARDGRILAVQWDSPAFKEALTLGALVTAVNGVAYTADAMKQAVTAAKGTTTPIELLIRSGERFRTARFDYHDGLRYPRLERTAGTPARLDQIFTAKP